MERTIRRIRRGAEAAADLAYWLARPMAERIAAVEHLRQQAAFTSGPDHAEPRLQRVCRVVRRQIG
jgi:hypothetical protein